MTATHLEKVRAGKKQNQVRPIDASRIRARRFELGVSEHALAAALGVEPGVIRRLERGVHQNEMNLEFVVELARVLGLALAELLVEAPQTDTAVPVDAADVAVLGTIVAKRAGEPLNLDRAGELCGWTLTRTLAAVDGLEAALAKVGQCLAWVGPADVILASPEDRSGVADRIATESAAVEGLNRLMARCVADVAAGAPGASRAEGFIPGLVRYLCGAGFLTTDADGPWNRGSPVRLTERARYDLCLDDSDAGPLPEALKGGPRKYASRKQAAKPKIPARPGEKKASR